MEIQNDEGSPLSLVSATTSGIKSLGGTWADFSGTSAVDEGEGEQKKEESKKERTALDKGKKVRIIFFAEVRIIVGRVARLTRLQRHFGTGPIPVHMLDASYLLILGVACAPTTSSCVAAMNVQRRVLSRRTYAKSDRITQKNPGVKGVNWKVGIDIMPLF